MAAEQPVPQKAEPAAKQSRKSPARIPQSAGLQRSTAKKTQGTAVFAVLDEVDDEPNFDDFAGLDAADWRIERRYRRRKDGKLIMYFNYRLRKVTWDADGNRIIKYRKGGSREI